MLQWDQRNEDVGSGHRAEKVKGKQTNKHKKTPNKQPKPEQKQQKNQKTPTCLFLYTWEIILISHASYYNVAIKWNPAYLKTPN